MDHAGGPAPEMLEDGALVAVYVAFMAGLVYAVIRLVLAIGRRHSLLLAPVIVVPLAIAVMIQWRCKLGTGYRCGFMSLEGGFTWHFWAALAAIAAGLVLAALALPRPGRSVLARLAETLHGVRALAGVWLYVVWVSLPVPFIHIPELGGICPRIPLICHDVPVLGLGGAVWYVGPFLILAAAGYLRRLLGGARPAE